MQPASELPFQAIQRPSELTGRLIWGVVDAGGRYVVTHVLPSYVDPESERPTAAPGSEEANAKFIALACNMHHRLAEVVALVVEDAESARAFTAAYEASAELSRHDPPPRRRKRKNQEGG